jgi:hypothetical protein
LANVCKCFATYHPIDFTSVENKNLSVLVCSSHYIAGIIEGKGQKSIIVNGVADHVHAFIGLKPTIAVSDLLRDVKNSYRSL